MTVAVLGRGRRFAGPSFSAPYGRRFAAAYGLLAVAVAGAIALGVEGWVQRPATPAQHAAAKPIDLAAAGVLASLVAQHYPVLDGRPAFTIAARQPAVGSFPLASIAVSRTGSELPLARSTKDLVEYTLCGQGPFCQYALYAAPGVQQVVADAEAVQLALDTFASVPGAGQVLVYVPATGPMFPSVALYFRRADVAPLEKGEQIAAIAAAQLDTGAPLKTLSPELRDVLSVAARHTYLFRGTVGKPGKAELVLAPLGHGALTGPRPLP